MGSKKKNLDFTINLDIITKTNKELDEQVKQIREIKDTVGNRLAATFLDDMITKVRSTQKDLTGLMKIINNPKLSMKERSLGIDTAMNSIKELGNAMKGMDKVWMAQALKNNKELLGQLDDLIQKRKDLTTQKGKLTKSKNASAKAEDALAELGYTGGTTKDDYKAIKKSINTKKAQLEAGGVFDQAELKSEIDHLSQVRDNLDIIIKQRAEQVNIGKAIAKLSAIDNKAGTKDPDAATKRLDKKIENVSSMTEDVTVIEKVSNALGQMNDKWSGFYRMAETEGPKMHASLEQSRHEAEELAETGQTLKQIFAQFGIGFSAYQIVNYFKDLAVEAFNFYKSLDAALNEIYVVSNLSSDAVDNLKTNFIAMAEDTGMALDDVTRAAVLFYQQGLNTDEVMEMTEVTAEFAKVAGIDATDAADKLTAAVNGYCLAAEDASLVADKFNKVAAASAADIDELSTAFSKAAAQANQAGVGMDNYLAYIATMVEATREAPENIGTSLKTIMSRMQQVKEAGTTEDDNTDVNKVETALKSVGVQLRDTEGELRNLEDVLDELGKKWQSLDRNTQAYLGTIIAGTRQQSRFITLMQNWDRVLELSEESAQSAGQQALMHAKAMESIESEMQKFSVAWQELVSNLTTSDFLKNIISFITRFIKTINSGTGPLRVLTVLIGVFRKQIMKGIGAVAKWTKNQLKWIKTFKQSIGVTNSNLKGVRKWTSSLKQIPKLYQENVKQIQYYNKELSNLRDLLNKAQQIMDVAPDDSDAYKQAAADVKRYGKEIESVTNSRQRYIEQNDAMTSGIEATITGFFVLLGLFGSMAESTDKFTAAVGKAGKIVLVTLGVVIPAAIVITTIAVYGLTTAIEMLKAALGIGTGSINKGGLMMVIGLLTIFITALVTAVTEAVDAFSVTAEELNESVEKVGEALQSYADQKTIINGAKAAKKEYDELANKIYRSADEQERLNTVAQELADSLEIEAIEDEYGNLTLRAEDIEEAMIRLQEEARKAREELAKVEQEEIEKYDHNGHVDDFYEQYLKTYRADLRNALDDIDTGIPTDELETSASNIDEIMRNLKDNVINNSAEMAEAFGGAGIHWSLTEDVEAMMDAFNNADIDSSQWNSLYQTFDTLQEKIDELSYDQALEVVSGAIKSWGKAAGLTAEQVNLMKDSIMDSLYSGSNLHKTVSGYDEEMSKMDGSYFDNKLKDYEKERDRIYKEADKNGEWDLWNPFNESDEEKQYEVQKKKINLLKDEQKAYEKIVKYDTELIELENLGLTNTEEYNKLLEKRNKLAEEYGASSREEMLRLETLRDITGKMSENSASWFNSAGLFDEDAFKLLENMDKSGDLDSIVGAYTTDEEKGTRMLTDYLVNVINNTNDEELRKVAQDKLENVFDNIQVRGTMNWRGLSTELEDTTDSLRKMTSVMEEFRENGGFTLETFADLCDILDSIDLATVFDTGMMDKYLGALENLELGFDAATGVITANGAALQSLEDIQEVATQAKLKQTAQSLEADKASLQSQIYAVEAEIAANQALIEWLKGQTKAEIDLDKIKEQGQVAYTDTMGQAAVLTAQQYQSMTSASSAWAESSITNAAKVGDAIKAAMTGNLGSGNLSTYLKGLISEMKWEDTGSAGQLELLTDKEGYVNREKAIAALEEYNKKGQNTINNLRAQMKSIEQMQNLLNKMSESDLSNLGLDPEEIEEYLGKLQEIYNILRKIEGVEARINHLQSYGDIARGSARATFLKEEIALSQDLVDLNKERLAQQKFMENTEQQAILNSPVGDVFSFDEFGNIIIDYEKYNALQDETIDGQQSLKELADNLYEEYEDLHGTTLEYYEELVESTEAAINAQQQLIDTYVDLETDLANAVKDIYQDMLDTKLEAIDDEIEALDKLREAREEANQAREDSKELSQLQTGLKRSMMDTSGASNTKVLDYQDQIQEKLEQMGEDEYTRRLDAITEALESEKEQLQRNFDEFFEDWEQLYDMIETRILPNEEAVLEVLKTTDEYRQAGDAERAQMVNQWKTDYAVAMTALQDGGTIMDVVESVFSLQDTVLEIDKLLRNKDYYTEVGNTISTALKEFYNSGKDGGGASSGNGSGGSSNNNKTQSTGGPNKSDTGGIKADKLKDLDDAKDAIKEWFDGIGEGISSTWTKFLEWIGGIGKAISDFFTVTIPEKFKAFGNWFMEHIGVYFTGDYWSEKFKVIGDKVQEFFTVTVPEKWNSFNTWLDENIWKYFTPEFWGEMVGIIIGTLENFFTITVPEKWNAFWTWLGEKKDELVAWVTDFFTKAIDAVTKFFTETIPTKWNAFWDWVGEKGSELIDKVVTFFTVTVPKELEKFFTETIPEKWDAFWTWIGQKKDEIVNGVKVFFTQTVPNFFSKLFTETIPKKWEEFKTWLKEKKDALVKAISDFFTKTIPAKIQEAKEAIKGAIKTVLNAGINLLNSMLNGIESLYNKSIGSFLKGIEKGYEKVTGKDISLPTTLDIKDIPTFKTGGVVDFTGPAWLDGTKGAPEAVLNAAQTKAFMKLADHLDRFDTFGASSNVYIESIEFKVDSMSSPQDGERAFDAFMNRFKEIGRQSGLSVGAARLN